MTAGGVGGESTMVGLCEMPMGVGGVSSSMEWQICEDPDPEQPVPPLLPISYIRNSDSLIDVSGKMMIQRACNNKIAELEDLETGHQSTSLMSFGTKPWEELMAELAPEYFETRLDANGKLPFMLANRTGTPAPDARLDVDRILADDSIECGDVKPTFSAVFAEWTPPEPAQTETKTETEQDSFTDYWTREPGCWVRVHKRPRRALFTPLGTFGGPPVSDLSVHRVTMLEYVDRSADIVSDRWCDKNGRRLMSKKWTGRTVFQIDSHQNPQVRFDYLAEPRVESFGPKPAKAEQKARKKFGLKKTSLSPKPKTGDDSNHSGDQKSKKRSRRLADSSRKTCNRDVISPFEEAEERDLQSRLLISLEPSLINSDTATLTSLDPLKVFSSRNAASSHVDESHGCPWQ